MSVVSISRGNEYVYLKIKTNINDFFLVIFFSVVEWEGELLNISKISRSDMGAYLCIASNGIPPSVSKRIKVSVDCKYKFVLS